MKCIYTIVLSLLVFGCTSNVNEANLPEPKEIIDLGALVTEDLPELVWGGLMDQYGFNESNSFRTIHQKFEFPDGSLSVFNSYLTLFNHGGPHVDSPKHVNEDGGIDSYSVGDFAGPLKVIDVSGFAFGRTVTLSAVKEHDIRPGDIVLIYTGYTLPGRNELPNRIALSPEAAEFLATLPVKAFGTDSFNVDSDDNPTEIRSDIPLQRIAPIHYEFLSRRIPVYEQLFNVDQLLGKQRMYFVGPPLNIKNGDGMMVRPVVMVYD